MPGSSIVVDLTLAGHVEGQPDIAELVKTIESLQAQVVELQAAAAIGGKDWLDYTQQIGGVAEAMSAVVNNAEDIAIKTVEIGAAIAVYQKWRTLVEGVQTAYTTLQGAITAAAAAGADTAGTAWGAVSAQTLKLETNIGSLVARFASLEALAKGFSFAGLALGLVQVAENAHASNEQARQLTEQIGGLTGSLQQLDPASKPVQIAKERFEELYKASLALHEDTPALVEQYKQFFDAISGGNLSIQQGGRLLTDFNQVQKSLRATTAETEVAQKALNSAIESGLTNIPQLSAVFGASLNPSLDAVAKQMGVTRQQLSDLIDNGQVGAVTVLPALAAAARSVTAPIQDTAGATEFAKKQFADMGETFYSLSGKTLPGVATALQYTAKEIANTADASVDPIGAAVERIENFGARIAEWARLTKQSLTDAFAGPDLKRAIDTGLKEAMYGLDYLLVGIKEEFTAVGESIGIVAGAAATATNPVEALKETWAGMGERLLNTRDRLNDYVNALEGADDASGRTAAGSAALAESLKTIPEIPLPDALKEIVDGLDSTQTASAAVASVWKELGGLDFAGGNIKNLALLRQSIRDVSEATGDATGTQAAFSAQLAKLPAEKLGELLAKVAELSPRLKAAGDDGALMQTVLGAAFEKLGLDAAEAAGKITQTGKDAAASFGLIAQQADISGDQIRAALDKALDKAKTQADVAAIRAEFDKLAESGQTSAQSVADGQAAIVRRLGELQTRLPGIESAFKDLGTTSSQHLRSIADSAAASFKQLQAGGATLHELEQGFLSWATAEIQAANAAGLPIPATLKHQAAALGLTEALGQVARRYRDIQPEQEAHATATAQVARAAHDYTGALAEVANAQISGLRAEVDLANAKGQTWVAQQKTVELAKLEAQWAQTLAAAKQLEIAAERASVEAKLAELQARNSTEEAVQKEIAALQLKMQALGQETEAIKLAAQVAAIKEQTAGQAAAQQRQSTEATQEYSGAVKENSAALEANIKHTNDGGAALKALSEYLGQTRTQMKGLSEMTALFFEKELQTALLHSPIEQSLKNVIAATVAYTAGLDASKKALANFKQEIANANALIDQSEQKMLFASNGFRQYEAAIEIAAGKAKKAYYEQKLAAEELRISIDEMAKTGADRTGLLAYAAQQAAHEFNLLSEQDLTGLRGAIDDATDKLKRLQDEARSAQDRIAELNAEIAREKGDTATADKLKLQIEQQRQIADVEAKLAEARTAQNADLIRLYEEQKRQLQELYDLKARNLEQDIRKKMQESAQSGAGFSQSATVSPIQSGGAARSGGGGGVTVNINAPNAGVIDDRFAENMARKIKPVLDNIQRRLD